MSMSCPSSLSFPHHISSCTTLSFKAIIYLLLYLVHIISRSCVVRGGGFCLALIRCSHCESCKLSHCCYLLETGAGTKSYVLLRLLWIGFLSLHSQLKKLRQLSASILCFCLWLPNGFVCILKEALHSEMYQE